MSVIIPVKDVFFVRLSDENDDAEDDVDECRKTDEDHRQSEPVCISSALVRGGLKRVCNNPEDVKCRGDDGEDDVTTRFASTPQSLPNSIVNVGIRSRRHPVETLHRRHFLEALGRRRHRLSTVVTIHCRHFYDCRFVGNLVLISSSVSFFFTNLILICSFIYPHGFHFYISSKKKEEIPLMC